MASRAAKWAETRAQARGALDQVDALKPKRSREVIVGTRTWWYEVGITGRAEVWAPRGAVDTVAPEQMEPLLDQARWLLLTFGSPSNLTDANAALDMYAEAWKREIRNAWPTGHTYHWGHHEIDVLVVRTRDAVEELNRLRARVTELETQLKETKK